MAPLKDALHLCMRAVLFDVPADAKVLCVGAGTGAEMAYLAESFPGWRFMLVEPSAPMLRRCRQTAESLGIGARCAFHEGFLDSLPPGEPFDVATSILVSQFILDTEARRDFFRGIAARLRPGGHLITSDLATPPESSLFNGWTALLRYNGFDEEKVAGYREALQKDVAVSPPATVEALVASAGFEALECVAHTLLIHTWHARRPAA